MWTGAWSPESHFHQNQPRRLQATRLNLRNDGSAHILYTAPTWFCFEAPPQHRWAVSERSAKRRSRALRTSKTYLTGKQRNCIAIGAWPWCRGWLWLRKAPPQTKWCSSAEVAGWRMSFCKSCALFSHLSGCGLALKGMAPLELPWHHGILLGAFVHNPETLSRQPFYLQSHQRCKISWSIVKHFRLCRTKSCRQLQARFDIATRYSNTADKQLWHTKAILEFEANWVFGFSAHFQCTLC